MGETVQKIRELLDDLESASQAKASTLGESFQLLELPAIIADIIDFLQPSLLPYEAAVYWYMLRHSIVATGDIYVRVSVRGLARKVITSSSGQSSSLSYGSVQDALAGLQKKGAISPAGDTNRE